MPKTKKISTSVNFIMRNHQRSASLFLIVLMVASIGSISFVKADQFDEKIKALNQQNGQNKAVQNQLGAEADSLSDAIGKLQAEIDAKQAQISAHQSEVKKLKDEIAVAEVELAKQRNILGETIKTVYLEGDISTVEMLASSKNLSDFFDKQQYRESVQSKVKDTLDKITQLKLDLSTRKDKTEKLIAEQKTLQNELIGQRSEKNGILALNENQQNALDQKIRGNNTKIAELRRQQAAANARLFGNTSIIDGGACSPRPQNTYPDKWCNRAQDSTIDSWGMYNRECVSYTAWKVHESGRYMPYWGGHGNANQWDDNARAAGYRVDGDPGHGNDGTVAVSNSGYYGHVMYVESVNGNGTINVSQYNVHLNGTYSTANGLSKAGLVFIHF